MSDPLFLYPFFLYPFFLYPFFLHPFFLHPFFFFIVLILLRDVLFPFEKKSVRFRSADCAVQRKIP